MTDAQILELPFNDEPENPAEPEVYRSLLEAWNTVLDSMETKRDEPIGMDWAAVIVGKWPFIRFSDLATVNTHFFRIASDLRQVVRQVLEEDPKAIEVRSREEDTERNGDLYLRILTDWHKTLLVEQYAWDTTAADAAEIVVALGEAQEMFTGKTGLASHMSALQLQFTEEDQSALETELREFRDHLEADRTKED
jgi:hypothetical protein